MNINTCMLFHSSINYKQNYLVFLNVNVNARRYIDNVLRPLALPFLRQTHTNMTMPQAHIAHLTVNFLAANRIQVLEWPPLSLDMCPIEHI